MTTLGLGWAILAVSGLPFPLPLQLVVGAAAALAATSVLAVARQSITRLPAHAGSRRRVSSNAGRSYQRINVAQTIVVVLAVFALVRVEQARFIPAVTCAVVGAHFLPLAKVFHLAAYWWTGALLLVTAVVGAFALILDVGTGEARVVVGLPAAVVLWTTSLVVARRG